MAFTYTKRADGRLMKRVSVNGKLETLYSNDPKDLEKRYIELKYLSGKGLIAEDNGITVEKWAKKWLETYKTDKEKATVKMYSHAINKHIIPNIGGIRLKFLKENDITNMLNELNDTPREKEIVFLTIKQILEKAVNNDLIYKNVANKVQIKKHRANEKTPLTDLEISYLKKVSEKDERCFMVLFMLYTGLRKQEVAALLYKDINLDDRTVSINKAVHWEKNQPSVKSTKNEEIRNVPILDIIYDTVYKMKTEHKDSDIVFPSVKTKNIMSGESIKRLLEHTLFEINKLYKNDQILLFETLNKTEEEIEIKTIKFSYHQLRHTYVCLLHKAGVSVKEAQYLTGHKCLNVLLNIYTHLDNEDKQNATNKLNELLKV